MPVEVASMTWSNEPAPNRHVRKKSPPAILPALHGLTGPDGDEDGLARSRANLAGDAAPAARLASSPLHAAPMAMPTPAKRAAKLVVSMPKKPRRAMMSAMLRMTATAVPM